MIRINLANDTFKTEAASPAGDGAADFGDLTSREATSQAIVRLAVILLGPIGLWLYSSMVIIPDKTAMLNGKQKTLTELTQKNASAASAVTEMKNFEQDEAKLKDQIGVIDRLRKDRSLEVRIMDLVQRDMPERMWLTKVDSDAHKIHIEGMSGSNIDRNQLIDTLNKSNLLKDVNLVKTTEETIEGNKLESFSIDCVFPTPEIKPPGKS